MIEDLHFVFDELLSDDEEVIEVIEAPRRPKMFRERLNHMEYWDDKDFLKRFRLSKRTVEILLVQINNEIQHPTNQNHALTPMTQLLIVLRFYATGTMEAVIGDFAGVSDSTVCQVIKKVSVAIARLSRQYIKFPQTNVQLMETKQNFEAIARFPNVIGAIDCTHIRIQSPGGPQAEQFRNRKGFFSINVQTVADSNLRITNIVARWPGSSHDRLIFDNCRLKAQFEEGSFGNSFLVGDQGYSLSKYMMIPLAETHNRGESLFNESQIRTRNCVERKYGVWKRRFPVLRLEIRLKLETCMAVIVATAVLHNVALEMNEEMPEDFEDRVPEENPDHDPVEPNPHIDGIRAREFLIHFFANL